MKKTLTEEQWNGVVELIKSADAREKMSITLVVLQHFERPPTGELEKFIIRSTADSLFAVIRENVRQEVEKEVKGETIN